MDELGGNMNKAVMVVAAGFLAFSLAGCTQSAPSKDFEAEPQEVNQKEAPPVEVQELKILEQGFNYSVDEWDNAFASFGVIVENPNTDYAFTGTKVRVSVKDSAGTLIATQEYYLDQMLPEEVYGFGDIILVTDEVSDVEITLIDGKSSSVDASYADFAPLKVIQANPIDDGYSLEVTGIIENQNDKTYDSGTVGIIFRDASGAIIWGAYSYVNDIVSGETPFSVYVSGQLAEDAYATIEAYTHIV